MPGPDRFVRSFITKYISPTHAYGSVYLVEKTFCGSGCTQTVFSLSTPQQRYASYPCTAEDTTRSRHCIVRTERHEREILFSRSLPQPSSLGTPSCSTFSRMSSEGYVSDENMQTFDVYSL